VVRLAIQGKLADSDIRSALAEKLPDTLADSLEAPLIALIGAARQENIPGEQMQAYTAALVGDVAEPLRNFYAEGNQMIPAEAINALLELLQIDGDNRGIVADLTTRLKDVPVAMEGLNELSQILDYLDALGVPDSIYQIRFAMVRGLAYYTGPIFETTIAEPKAMPSITGGGRYDELIGLFSGKTYPAVGASLGIERIIDAMDELDMFPPEIKATTADVLVTVFSQETAMDSLRVARMLREQGINTAQYFDPTDRLGDQIGYAASKGISFVVVLGPEEIEKGIVTVRRLGASAEDSEQRQVPLNDLVNMLRSW
jgi:histidyl-tRNA synthetase